MRLPESIRELRPHFWFWIIEKIAGAAAIAAALAFVQWFKQHWDIWTIVGIFIASLIVMLWIDRARRTFEKSSLKETTPEPDAEFKSAIEVIDSHHADALEDARSQIEQLMNEVARLNAKLEHREMPKLVLEVEQYAAVEILGEPLHLFGGGIEELAFGTNNHILVRVNLIVRNEHNCETYLDKRKFYLCVYERKSSSSVVPVYGVTYNTNYINNTLLEPIKFAFPIEGWVHFRLEHTTAPNIIRHHFEINVTDGAQQTFSTPEQTFYSIAPPSPV